MNRFRFGGLETPGLYLDETVMRMCQSHRRLYAQLARRLMDEGKTEKAAEVVAFIDKAIPDASLPHSYSSGSLDLANVWLNLGKKQKVETHALPVAQNAVEYLEWYLTYPNHMLLQSNEDFMYYLYQLHNASDLLAEAGSSHATEMVELLGHYEDSIRKRLYGAN